MHRIPLYNYMEGESSMFGGILWLRTSIMKERSGILI